MPVEEAKQPDPMLVSLATATVQSGASDLHLTVGRPATVRRDGTLVSFEGVPVLTSLEIDRMIMSLLSDEQKEELAANRQVDFSFGLPGVGRFRANAFSQRESLALALRVVPFRVRTLEELGAPSACTSLSYKPYGIVLVVGPTGSGKSTNASRSADRRRSFAKARSRRHPACRPRPSRTMPPTTSPSAARCFRRNGSGSPRDCRTAA